MGHTYSSCHYHVTWSTKNRRKIIDPSFRDDLWSYIAGIARQNGFQAIIVGGAADHVHALLALRTNLAPAKAVQLIKGGSSKWLNDIHFSKRREFAGQEGYGVFTVGFSRIPRTKEYIMNQEEHHRHKTFEEEFRAFLAKHRLEFDEASFQE